MKINTHSLYNTTFYNSNATCSIFITHYNHQMTNIALWCCLLACLLFRRCGQSIHRRCQWPRAARDLRLTFTCTHQRLPSSSRTRTPRLCLTLHVRVSVGLKVTGRWSWKTTSEKAHVICVQHATTPVTDVGTFGGEGGAYFPRSVDAYGYFGFVLNSTWLFTR